MVNGILIPVLFIGVLLLLYVLGVPVAVAMGLTSIAVMLSPLPVGFSYGSISSQFLYGVNSFPLLAVPLYILLGRLLNRSGMTSKIFRFANAVLGRVRGGIAYTNIVGSIIFAGMSGAAVADAAGLGRIEYSAMREYEYDKKTAVGVTASSSIIGPIIPPSLALIIYGVLAGASIGQLFVAGVVPGIILGATLMVFTYVLLHLRGIDTKNTSSLSEIGASFLDAIPPLMIPVIIIGGLLSGYFTPTEAGAVAVLYVVIVDLAIDRNLSVRNIYDECTGSMVETSALLFIIAAASLYGLVALQMGIPQLITRTLTGFTTHPKVFLLIVALTLIVMGTFMDTSAAITVFVPILVPVIQIYQIDPVYFGIVVLLALLLGLLTPPLGVVLFVMEKVTDASLETIIRGVAPFYVPIFVVLILIILFPGLVMFLPNLAT